MYNYQKKKLQLSLGRWYDILKKYDVIIAGGSIRSIFCNDEINDFDIYVKSQDNLIKLLKELYDNCFMLCHTNKATLFKTKDDDELMLQVIHLSYFSSPHKVFRMFDFTACMGAYDFKNEQFELSDGFLADNASRILNFNSATAFPLVSALRVDKYRDKGYTISKASYLRVILKCMSLDIKSWDELKEHLGGMYGIDLSKLFDDTKEFSLESALKQLDNIYLKNGYGEYEKDNPYENINGFEDLLNDIKIVKIIYDTFKFNDMYYYIDWDGYITNIEESDKLNVMSIYEYFTKHKLIKNVYKDKSKYFSFYDNSFEYKMFESVEAKNREGLYFVLDKDNLQNETEDDKVTITIAPPKEEDIIAIENGNIRLHKAMMIGELTNG